jgi:hypothetical protein
MSPHDNALPPHLITIFQILVDFQFGVGVSLLLLALGNLQLRRTGAAVLLWRLNRRLPSGSSVILACHFPFMMFAVAVASRAFAIPIAGEPRFILFVLFAGQVIAICSYGLLMSSVSQRLVRLRPGQKIADASHAVKLPVNSG